MARDRLLVVEDEDIVRHSMVRVLARAGYAVDEASSGFDALDMISKNRYDLTLVDIKMPRMSGIEFLERARQIDSQVAAVVITGYATMEQAIKAMELGSQGFVMKPVYPDQLIQVVKNTLHRQHLSREIQRLQAFSPFLDLSRIVLGQGDLPTMVKSFIDTVITQTHADQGALFLKEGSQLKLAIQVGFPMPPAPPSSEAMERLGAWIQKQGDAMLSGGDFLAWPQLNPVSTESMSILCLPLVLHRNLLGLVVLGHREPEEVFSRSDVEFLWVMCGLLSMGLGNFYMSQRLNAQAALMNEDRQVQEQRLREIGSLYRLLHSREGQSLKASEAYHEMRQHYHSLLKMLSDRTEQVVTGRRPRFDIGTWVEALCEGLQIPKDGLLEAVYLRNLGYLKATDRAGAQGGTLHPAEDHPQNSADELRSMGLPEHCWKAVLHHHENYDGTGFPDGLSGKNIPLEARLLRVLEDSYDLVNGDTLGGELAERRLALRLEQGSGSLYDPQVVDAFLKTCLFKAQENGHNGM